MRDQDNVSVRCVCCAAAVGCLASDALCLNRVFRTGTLFVDMSGALIAFQWFLVLYENINTFQGRKIERLNPILHGLFLTHLRMGWGQSRFHLLPKGKIYVTESIPYKLSENVRKNFLTSS